IYSIAIISMTLLITGLAMYALARRSQIPEQTFSATINRDCAPWDGSAFTVSIPMEGKGIAISIYQSPEIEHPTTFLFAEDTLSTGNALLILPLGSPQQLTGKVSFQNVARDTPVKGQFDLVTNSGKHFKGKFSAEWKNEIVLCG
ncbi:MAG TPA: hypothetical protein VKB04_07670, partial [Anaerolineales bacterium]|nr:hypothetical protein [Anaerolineales bacterium]